MYDKDKSSQMLSTSLNFLIFEFILQWIFIENMKGALKHYTFFIDIIQYDKGTFKNQRNKIWKKFYDSISKLSKKVFLKPLLLTGALKGTLRPLLDPTVACCSGQKIYKSNYAPGLPTDNSVTTTNIYNIPFSFSLSPRITITITKSRICVAQNNNINRCIA